LTRPTNLFVSSGLSALGSGDAVLSAVAPVVF